jgi:hypothetical protein
VIGLEHNELSAAQLGERCRTAARACDVAGRALDLALKNGEPATEEWNAELQARMQLHAARDAYVAESRRLATVSAAVRDLIRTAKEPEFSLDALRRAAAALP